NVPTNWIPVTDASHYCQRLEIERAGAYELDSGIPRTQFLGDTRQTEKLIDSKTSPFCPVHPLPDLERFHTRPAGAYDPVQAFPPIIQITHMGAVLHDRDGKFPIRHPVQESAINTQSVNFPGWNSQEQMLHPQFLDLIGQAVWRTRVECDGQSHEIA